MQIRVEIKNEILGDSVFWEGDIKGICQIRNIVAKNLAEKVAQDGRARKSGMWRVKEIK